MQATPAAAKSESQISPEEKALEQDLNEEIPQKAEAISTTDQKMSDRDHNGDAGAGWADAHSHDFGEADHDSHMTGIKEDG